MHNAVIAIEMDAKMTIAFLIEGDTSTNNEAGESEGTELSIVL